MSSAILQTEKKPEALLIEKQLQKQLQLQKEAFLRHSMPSKEERMGWLTTLKKLLLENQETLAEAIHQDFQGRSKDETKIAEILSSVESIRFTQKNLSRWMKPTRRSVHPMFQPASNQILYQPLGTIGIIVPWNYPLFLALGPLVGALAAGNRVMLKLSEFVPQTSALLKTMLEKAFPQDLVTVVTGDSQVGIAFSKLPFDHLLFTGSTQVGRLVMMAAAENLTPVTLELGGKSPAFVSPSVPIQDAAERICFGKSFNAGQTCVAPDYILCPENKVEAFIDCYANSFARMYPSFETNPDYTSVVNSHQKNRLKRFLEDAQQKGAQTHVLTESKQWKSDSCRMPPHIITDVSDDMVVMQEEIFGPLLPIVAYKTAEEALAYVKSHPRPLALYFFGYDKKEQNTWLEQTHSGGVCINDSLIQVGQEDLPFGGIGPSGMGHYHGHEGFLTFSKAKAVHKKQRFNALKMSYPPYGNWLHKLLYRFILR